MPYFRAWLNGNSTPLTLAPAEACKSAKLVSAKASWCRSRPAPWFGHNDGSHHAQHRAVTAAAARRPKPQPPPRGDENDSVMGSITDDDVAGFTGAHGLPRDPTTQRIPDPIEDPEAPYEDLLQSSPDPRMDLEGFPAGPPPGEALSTEEEDVGASPVLGRGGPSFDPSKVSRDEWDESEVDEVPEDEGEGDVEGEGEADVDVEEDAAVEEEQPTTPSESALDYDELMKSLGATRGSRVTVEVVEEDLESEEMKAASDAAAKQARKEASYVVPEQQSFTEFELDGVTLLVSEDASGRLALADSYVYDHKADVYERPALSGNIPIEYLTLQIVPWMERRYADTLKQKEAVEKMRKVYFLGVATERPYVVDMSTVYSFDDGKRVLTEEVVHSAVPISSMQEPTLRIRAKGVTVEEAEELPNPLLLSEGEEFEDNMASLKPVKKTMQEILAEEEQKEEEREQRMADMEEEEKMTLELDLDIPASDMM